MGPCCDGRCNGLGGGEAVSFLWSSRGAGGSGNGVTVVCVVGFSPDGFSGSAFFEGPGAGSCFAVTPGCERGSAGAGFAELAGFWGAGAGSSVRVTGLDVEITPDMQQVSERLGGTPVFRAHIAFGPFAPGQEYVQARHFPSFLHAFSHKSGFGADSSMVL